MQMWIRQSYLEFLSGNFDYDLMHNVDYDAVSTNLGAYLLALRVELKPNEHIVFKIVNDSMEIKEAYREIEIENNVFNRSQYSPEEIDLIGIPKFVHQ